MALVELGPEELEKRYSITFHDDRDDLDSLRLAVVRLESGAFDCVMSNGVINLAADKASVFLEAARLLKPGGRLAIADIITEQPLPAAVR